MLVLVVACAVLGSVIAKPNIIVFLADDLGWNDVGFHGSSQIGTPNIDALAYKGMILNRHYTQPTCSPSRAAFLTGRYPVRTGVHVPMRARAANSLPLNHTLLPEYLGRLGYQSHLIGKWHLGFHHANLLPTRRGFQSHFGYWSGTIGYFDGIYVEGELAGIDIRRNEKGAWQEISKRYITDVLTQEAVSVVENHDESRGPLFLEVALSAPHSGNRGAEFQVRNLTYNEQLHYYIPDIRRRLYAGMVRAVDDSVGAIMKALNKRNLLKDSIVLFSSDNGAPTTDLYFGYENLGSNWPLRGVKTSCHEGGVRSATAIWSPRLPTGRVSDQLIHISDWLPTLYSAAGGNLKDLGEIDGVNQWNELTNGATKGPRLELLVDLNPYYGNEAFISWPWKLVKYPNDNGTRNEYVGDSGRGPGTPFYSTSEVISSQAATAVNLVSDEDLPSLRAKASLDNKCPQSGFSTPTPCYNHYCLFNLDDDPCERRDLSSNQPSIVASLRNSIARYRSVMVEPQRRDRDPRADPSLFGQYWDTWADGHAVTPSSASTTLSSPWWLLLIIGTLRLLPSLTSGSYSFLEQLSSSPDP